MNQEWNHFLETGAVVDYLSYKAADNQQTAKSRSGDSSHGKVDSDRYGNVSVACGRV